MRSDIRCTVIFSLILIFSAYAEATADGNSIADITLENDAILVGIRSVPLDAVISSPPAYTSVEFQNSGTGRRAVEEQAAAVGRFVELIIRLPDDAFAHMGHIEVFVRDDLGLSPEWNAGDSWIPTYGCQTIHWTDPFSSELQQRFYLVSNGADGDGDGHSDLYEAWVGGTDSNVFNVVDTDGDDFHDWLEMKLFGDLSQTAADDYDLDGLLNGEEVVAAAVNRPAVMFSDPALFDSDNEGLSDFTERVELGTDPMNPDSDGDGIDDAAEVLGYPPTDPNNPDTTAPVIVLAGG